MSDALQTARLWHSTARWFLGFAVLTSLTRLCLHLGASLSTTALAHLILIVLLSLPGYPQLPVPVEARLTLITSSTVAARHVC